ncbi:hypothetical protein [Halocalculus aciditolerans]|uniref:Uncharacterized protein n=1 Tax=Halocalculus aciditolerans TaxID=1383812 RepID=A0A830FFU6_9EURY|nr:hypothetical protein [Halocalculus aciditolerans]GGL51168.1 hypothetical protein GCM10009039_06770 [Halocalculus aciditolerans]
MTDATWPPRLPAIERFARLVVAGGLLLLVGLWTTELTASLRPLWLVGVALSLLGVAALAAGIYEELDT